MLNMLAIYAAGGGIDLIVEAWLLARRRRRMAGVPAWSRTAVPRRPRTRPGRGRPQRLVIDERRRWRMRRSQEQVHLGDDPMVYDTPHLPSSPDGPALPPRCVDHGKGTW